MAVAPLALALDQLSNPAGDGPLAAAKASQLVDITGVYRGRELTRKDRRIASGLAPIDILLGGGIVRGRISEIIGPPGCGITSLAAAFAAVASHRGEVTAWLDAAGGFDPASIAMAGADLARMLWVAAYSQRTMASIDDDCAAHPFSRIDGDARQRTAVAALKAAEWILAAGGFGLVVIDFGTAARALTPSAALRLARGAERGSAAVLVLATHRICGTFAALTLALRRNRACFSRIHPGAPALFDGLTVEARVTRNKLGGSGGAAIWRALADPSSAIAPAWANELTCADAPSDNAGRRAATR
jgi:recA bacterial DNA recombination protein